jgi:hypothetical protein
LTRRKTGFHETIDSSKRPSFSVIVPESASKSFDKSHLSRSSMGKREAYLNVQLDCTLWFLLHGLMTVGRYSLVSSAAYGASPLLFLE